MALIIKNREIVEDNWQVVRAAEDGALPEVAALPAGKVLVPFALWQAGGDALVASRSKDEIGVWLEPDSEPADIAGDFDKLALIGVDFPVFRDGRGYSIGRLLRERFGYKGELRAIGDVLHDFLYFMKQCGFDSFALRDDQDVNEALAAFDTFSDGYQTSVLRPVPLFRRRFAAAKR